MNLRFLQRLLCSVFVVWFALFPTLSYASETETNIYWKDTYDWREAEREILEYIDDEKALYSVSPDDVANGLVQASFHYFTQNPWTEKYISNPVSWVSPMAVDVYEFSAAVTNVSALNSSAYGSGLSYAVYLDTVDGSALINKSSNFDFVLNGLKTQIRYQYRWQCGAHQKGATTEGYFPIDASKINQIAVNMYDKNNNLHQVFFDSSSTSNILTINGDTFGLETQLVAPDFDVTRMEVHFYYPLSAYGLNNPTVSGHEDHMGAVTITGIGLYFQGSMYDGVLKIDVEDENVGLLKGIVEWLKSIRDGIVNVANYIIELPSRIWTFIQEGLKMLFIPSEEDITQMHEDWQLLMRDRFGAIYESGDIVHSFSETMSVNSAMVADTGGVITMPAVTANLAGTNFTFGGYEVDLVPDGFQWLVTSLKMLINIVCTILFINALKGKIEVLLK